MGIVGFVSNPLSNSSAGNGAGARDDTAPVGIVSPHLDDAVLSCGQLLVARPGSHVVTVFSSGPQSVDPLPFWDRMCESFEPGDDVMAIRRDEDDAALDMAGAIGHRLGFWDGQYRMAPPVRLARLRPAKVRAVRARHRDDGLSASVRDGIAAKVAELGLSTWFVPLGLQAGDHEVVASACLDVAAQMPAITWIAYEELPYRAEGRSKARAPIERLCERGFRVTSPAFDVDPDLARKRTLIECHRSQLKALGERVDAAVAGPEVYHLLVLVPTETS